ncbi:exodeoxyribonuclease VII small subunit [Litorivicinus sp.]|jgi:exodeoxyribonuclease VII small subunit|nr:exodeoxyribonuclease VII small subunit [Litorivicinus sp.]MDB9862052.1 exodeoxyribonuclease VII small subunit [Litorivicinus sp.]MDC1208209.1 exodeoxyribonuclease VII small subunit [Litorivicinus sp.]MDC1319628.1 exodeoxyribonuclease VII small subunit [Litorivicinus sp.]|tara:strand:+ start:124 stop:351 length:228 start_codon:yes stop_codon:yes gene_type:complete
MSAHEKPHSFESKLAELEHLVRQMEQGSMPLDSSLDAFEKGVKLAKDCHQILDSASQKVTEIKQTGEQSDLETDA